MSTGLITISYFFPALPSSTKKLLLFSIALKASLSPISTIVETLSYSLPNIFPSKTITESPSFTASKANLPPTSTIFNETGGRAGKKSPFPISFPS